MADRLREIIFDTETTGLEPTEGHRLVELGCVEMVDKVRTGRTYHAYINPQMKMPYGAFKVHGLSDDFLADKPLFQEVANDFIEFLDLNQEGVDTKLVIHNAAFDMKFINHEFSTLKIPSISNKFVIDTLTIARKKYPGQKNNLDALCNRFDISLASREKHGALLDAELLTEVYIELCGGKQANLIFDEEDNESASSNEDKKDSGNKVFFSNKKQIQPREYKITEAEQKAHEEFVKEKIKESIW